MAGVYWTGQDGKTWVKSSGYNGALGTDWANNQNAVDMINGLSRISDPNAPEQAPQQAPAGGGGGGGGTQYKPLNQQLVDNTQGSINSLDGILARALANERNSYANVQGDFNAQEGEQRGQYKQSTDNNMGNYDSNFMAALRSGAKGLGGLMSALRGTGSGEDWGRETVAGVTANDIRTGADTFKENQTGLDNTLSSFVSDLERKRRAADDTFASNKSAITRDSLTQRQELLNKMAELYGDAGQTATANNWLSQSGALTPQIAQNSVGQVSKYGDTAVPVKAAELSAFADATQPNTAINDGTGGLGAGLFTVGERERRRQQAGV